MNIVYSKNTETIRQMPENYLIAHKIENVWVCIPDLAANKKILVKTFKLLLEFDNKYGTGENLVSKIKAKKYKLLSW